MYTTQKQGRTMAVLDCWTVSVHPLSRISMKSAKYCDENWTICSIVIIFINDPKDLGSSNKIESLRNKKKTFFNLPNMFRRYICLLFSVLQSLKSPLNLNSARCCKVLALVICAVLLCYLNSSEGKAWKIRVWAGLEPWPLRCWCSAPPVELSGQLGAGRSVGQS